MPSTLSDQIAAAAEQADLGRPSARKTGRNPSWPYVPIVVTTDTTGMDHETQLLGLAYPTRIEALARAARHTDALREQLARHLANPRYRALREQHGLPREIAP